MPNPSPSRVSINAAGRRNAQSVSLGLRRIAITLVTAAAFTVAPLAGAADSNDNEHWVGTWGNALHQPAPGFPGLSNSGFHNQTLRQIVHISVGGPRVRVRLSAFASGGVTIGAAHVALHDTGSGIVSGSDRTLTFNAGRSITIPPGGLVVSDPVDLNVPAQSDLAVSIFVLGDTGPATWHFDGRQISFISPPGDFTASDVLPVSSTTRARFWLAGVEVLAPRQTGAIAAIGTSFTDGSRSTVNANHRWPDYLAQRLLAQYPMSRFGNQALGVLNEGIPGNRLLHDGLGPSGLARFDRDVLDQPGVTHVIVELGSADTFFFTNPAEEVSADEIIQGHKQLIQRAHAKGLKIFGCTWSPGGFLDPVEGKRQALNAWIRTSGEYDAVIDFDLVLRDPNAPSKINAVYDSGDHGHPNDLGDLALANAIDLRLFNVEGRQ